jgi:hypothetical protein
MIFVYLAQATVTRTMLPVVTQASTLANYGLVSGNLSQAVPASTPVLEGARANTVQTGLSIRDIAVAAGAAGGGVVFASVAVYLVLLRRSGSKVRVHQVFLC